MERNLPKLHIIVNCASRKRISPKISLGEIAEPDLEKRAEIWWKRLNNPSNFFSQNDNLSSKDDKKLEAINLYIGSYWASIRKLPTAAVSAGFDPRLWIISAGYGLISASEEISSYSATFSKYDEDSVITGKNSYPTKTDILQNWWKAISNYAVSGNNQRSISQLIKNHSNDYFLIVASFDYLSAIEQDLVKGLDFFDDLDKLIIITSKSKFFDGKLSKHLIPSDARLQCNKECPEFCEKHFIKPGIRGAISSNLALRIIETVKIQDFNALKIKSQVADFIKQSPELLKFNRTRLKDDKVREFIAKELNKTPSSSCSFLLRKLRNSGQACEQKRFTQIYRGVKENEI